MNTKLNAPRLVKPGSELSLAEQIAAYKRIEREQVALRSRITERGRALACAEGRKMMPRFEDVMREHGALNAGGRV